MRALSRLIDPFRPADGPPPARVWPFFRWCLNGAWTGLGVAALASALGGVADVVSAVLLGTVIDTLLSAPKGGIWAQGGPLILGFAGFFLIVRPLVYGVSTAASNLLIAPNIMPLVLSRLHRWTMGQPVVFFDNDFTGRIAQKQNQTARAVTDVASDTVNVVAFALAAILGSAAFFAGISGWGALALLLWLVAYLGLIRFFLPRVRSRSARRAAARAMVTGQVVDTITNIKTVKLFAHARHEDQEALSAMAEYRTRALAFGEVSTLFRMSLMAVAGVLPVMLVGGTAMLWQHGGASAGDVATAGAISMRLAQMTGWVSMSLMSLWGSLGEAEDGMHTLARPYTLADAPDATEVPHLRGDVVFDRVGFHYHPGGAGLHDLSLHIRPGERVGIVGASGAGKSTLVALLLRLYDVETGAVRVDGHDVRTLSQESLRRHIAMVTQETALFNRSARDNILYGRPDATEAEVIAAARAAGAHEFILDLRDTSGRQGYDAHLGERGVKLSGGQRQRIALARAFLKDAPILVLDEATSALDSTVEAEIQRALDGVMAGKTVLAIAHRLSTLSGMDRIVVMDQGRIVESGTHDALIAADGAYATFWAHQGGGA